jgi:hypothetical protein
VEVQNEVSLLGTPIVVATDAVYGSPEREVDEPVKSSEFMDCTV